MMQSEMIREEQHLQRMIEIASRQKEEANLAIERQKEEMLEAKKEVRENTTYGLSDLYDNDEFEALVEMKQCMDHVSKLIRDYDEEQRKLKRLEGIMKKPYFGRIDFQFEDGVTEEIYIGRAPLSEKRTRENYIYDWRSPVAGVFYRFITGRAFYDAPAGRIEGELKRKRQYEIEDGRLQFFFDTDRNISDDILRQMLSQNASPKMKAIVETIQREQDVIIRDMESDLLMVQGVAGSGKTSIALHRVAYLMYQGLQARLAANNILILSPNAAFEEYISDVLPELGEDHVETAVFEDVLRGLVRDREILPYYGYLENIFRDGRRQTIEIKSMRFKTSVYFLDILDYYLEELPTRRMKFRDISIPGKGVLEAKKIKNRFLRRGQVPYGIRLEQLQTFAREALLGTGFNREDWENREYIRQELRDMTGLQPLELYRELFRDQDFLEELMLATEYLEDLEDLCEYTLAHIDSGHLLYEDAVAICYLSLRIYGTDDYRHIRQVVIDEAQDYAPIHYDIFRMLYPNAKFTVLGDVNQTLAKQEDMSFYRQVQARLGKKNCAMVVLDKSFRCTNEILNFSLQFIENRPEITNFNRSGEAPEIVETGSYGEYLQRMLQVIEGAQAAGLKSICLLCKTQKTAEALYEALKDSTGLCLFQGDRAESLQGVLVMPAYLSKGLEFDGVIICDGDEENYDDEEGRRLLYVECTRALHRLWLFRRGGRKLPG